MYDHFKTKPKDVKLFNTHTESALSSPIWIGISFVNQKGQGGVVVKVEGEMKRSKLSLKKAQMVASLLRAQKKKTKYQG